MHIINVMQCTNLGGMEQASLRLMLELQGMGHTFEVISLNPLGPLAPALFSAKIPAKGLDYRGVAGWPTALDLAGELRMRNGDALIVTGHHLLASLAVLRARVRRRVLAIHFHHENVKPEWQWRIIYFIACRVFDAITFPSEFIKREAERIHPPVRRISHLVRNTLRMPALPTPAERASARARLGISEGERLVGNAGWLIDRKRFDVFLRVAARLAGTVDQLRFIIAGDGPNRESLEALARELGIADRVRWLGWQENLKDFYSAIDVLLFNTDYDALGLTVLEAMSYGIPVVASARYSGLSELLSGGEYGVLIPDHDLEQLAAGVSRFLGPEGGAVGAAGRRRAGAFSDPAVWVPRMERLLQGG